MLFRSPENRLAKLRTSRTFYFNAGISGVPSGAPVQPATAPHAAVHSSGDSIRFIGALDVPGNNALFAPARALLHLNAIPERFGLVLAEANAAGVPVIAMDLGSCREVIGDGQTGFLVNNVDEAVLALARLGEINRNACLRRVQERFSIETMVAGYEQVYRTVFELEETT